MLLRAAWWGLPASEMQDLPQLQELARSDEPILWFGPDPWEQACLLWVLAELPEGLLPGLVPLHHSVTRLPPASLPRCFAERILLEAGTLGEVRSLWGAFLAGGWGALGEARVAALPALGPALARLAEDHPPVGPGRTRRQIQDLVDQGVRDLPAFMMALDRMEDPQHGAWCGDLFVARMVEAMGVRIG
jgi:hypothetical protein